MIKAKVWSIYYETGIFLATLQAPNSLNPFNNSVRQALASSPFNRGENQSTKFQQLAQHHAKLWQSWDLNPSAPWLRNSTLMLCCVNIQNQILNVQKWLNIQHRIISELGCRIFLVNQQHLLCCVQENKIT